MKEAYSHKNQGVSKNCGEICPRCQAIMPAHNNYVVWCDKCNWNLTSETTKQKRKVIDKIYESLGRKFSKKLFEKIVKLPTIDAPTMSIARQLAYLVVVLTNGLTVVVFSLGIYLMIAGWPHPVIISLGFVSVGTAYCLRPRFRKWPARKIMSRSQYPALYALLDKIAEEFGASSIFGIIIDEDFNASITQFGFKKRKLLRIGLPLFSILNPQEKVAVLSHELAHGVNRDPTRGLLFGATIDTLQTWYYFLYPEHIWESESGLFGLLMVPGKLLMRGLAELTRLCLLFMSHLLWHDSQRAEYFADLVAARVCGTEAALSAFEKMHYSTYLTLIVQKIALSDESRDIFEEFRDKIDQMPQHEKERVKRLDYLHLVQLNSSHPPTAYRMDVLKAHHVSKPKVNLSPYEADRIEQELLSAKKEIQNRLIEKYKDSLYF